MNPEQPNMGENEQFERDTLSTGKHAPDLTAEQEKIRKLRIERGEDPDEDREAPDSILD